MGLCLSAKDLSVQTKQRKPVSFTVEFHPPAFIQTCRQMIPDMICVQVTLHQWCRCRCIQSTICFTVMQGLESYGSHYNYKYRSASTPYNLPYRNHRNPDDRSTPGIGTSSPAYTFLPSFTLYFLHSDQICLPGAWPLQTFTH